MNCALMIDIRGREIRMSHNDEKGGIIRVRSGSQVSMIGGQFKQASDGTCFRINQEGFQRYLKPNDLMYIDDGKVVGIVTQITEDAIKLEVKIGGTIKCFSQVKFIQSRQKYLPIISK